MSPTKSQNMTKLIRGLISGIILLALSQSLHANTPHEPVSIKVGTNQFERVNKKTVSYLDANNKLTITDIISNPIDWKRLESDNVVYDLQRTTVWIKLRLANEFEATRKVFLEFNPVFLENISAFDETGTLIGQTGSRIKASQLQAFPTLDLDLKPGISDVYISLQSRANTVAITLRSGDLQAKKESFDIAIFSSLLGGLLVLMFYHLFLYLTYRNVTYLSYSLFMSSTILFTISFTSFHRQLLPPMIGNFEIDFWWSALSAPIMFFAMYVFSANLLSLLPKKGLPWYKQANTLLLILPVVDIACIGFVVATDDPVALIPIRFSALVHMASLTSVAMFQWLRNRRNIIALFYALSWVPFAVGAVLIVCWLTGVVGHNDIYSWSLPIGVLIQSFLLAFAAGQQLNVVTLDKLREQQAKLRVMKELEVYVKDLEKRDSVITAFASSEIVSELDRREDPLAYQPRNVEKCIVFLDMHEFTSFSESRTALECHSVLNEYFALINDTTYAGGGKVDKIIGDAMMIVFDDPKKCLSSIIQLRRNLSNLNRARVSQNLPPIKFGAGISYGTMLSANFGSSQKCDRTLVGDNVNVASRLENITRAFAVDVLCSKEFMELHPDYKYFRPAGYVLLKGRKKKSLVYECFEHNIPEVVSWKAESRPTIEKVISLELDGKYLEAISLLGDLIERCPPHSYKEGMIMDLTLVSMLSAIEEKMRQIGINVPERRGSNILNLKRVANGN